jgi:hypothetical protein
MADYIVVAGYVTAPTAVPGGRAWIDIPRGTQLPGDVPAEVVETLLARGAIEQVSESSEVEPPHDPPVPAETPEVTPQPDPDVDENDQGDGDPMPVGPIPAVLAWVGDDRDRAMQALEVERAATSPRRSLIAQLERLRQDGDS